MQKRYLIIISVICFALSPLKMEGIRKDTTNNFIYWENMTSQQQKEFLNSNKINKNALTFYEGELHLSDNEITLRLLDTLVSVKNIENKNVAFYFFLFNKICLKADGALAEILGSYCQKLILNIPEYVINYFKQNKSILKKNALILGEELYFKEGGTSTLEYNFTEFKNILYEKLNNKQESNAILEEFFSEIRMVMNKME